MEATYTELEKDYIRETNAQLTDSLTGLFNNGFFQIALNFELERFQRYGVPFTLAMIDIDSFVTYNKRYGSIKGDCLLKEIAEIIKKNTRKVNVAARYSGDVFTIIFTKSEPHQALVCLERIMQGIQTLSDKKVTVSVGVATCPRDATKEASIIKKAQEALTKSKINGGNKIDCFEEEIKPNADRKTKIMIVDDEVRNLKVLEAYLIPLQYEVIKASSGKEALAIIKREEVDLILLDVMMPEMDGYEVCQRLKGNENTRIIPIIFITALDDSESKIKGIEVGADDFITKPPNKMELITRVKSLVHVKALNSNLTSLESVLFSLANTVEAKDECTNGHIWRVSKLAMALGKKLDFSEKSIKEIGLGGVLHDIGKIGIPGEILNKPGKLNPEEFDVMKQHAEIGYKICLPLKKPLGAALDMIRYHHETLNGSGYPDGLKGDEIPIEAQVMSVIDIYDALLTDRPYRKAMPIEKVRDILQEMVDEGKLNKQIVEYILELDLQFYKEQ